MNEARWGAAADQRNGNGSSGVGQGPRGSKETRGWRLCIKDLIVFFFFFFPTWNVDEIGIGPKAEGDSRTASRLNSLAAVQHRGWAMQSLPFLASSYPVRTKFDRTRSAEPLADMAVDGERYPRPSTTAPRQVKHFMGGGGRLIVGCCWLDGSLT